ncbi:MAG: S41 family peptidase [Fimbriiglobus sp.]
MSRWNLAWLLGVPAVVLLGLAVSASAPPPSKDYQLVRTVVDVLSEVDRHYYRELTDAEKQKLVEDMVNGGLERLDPHSQYFNEDELKMFESTSDGEFGGIGVILASDPKTSFLKVESPMPGTPAYEAGVQAGELILKVGDKSTENMKVDEARLLIKGPPGTPITLTILSEATRQTREVTLNRALIELHPVMGFARRADDPAKWEFLADPANKIALIRLIGFNEKSDKELKIAVEDAEKAGAKALVLDMRDNPGGLLNQAVSIADLFLDDGTIVTTRDRDGATRGWTAKPGETIFGPADKRPMAVLVNRNSASAAEIVASALQDNKRAVVVGERSYGKGSVQKVYPLSVAGRPTGAVKLTTEVWLTPKAKNIHRWPDSKDTDEWGVVPDAGFDVKLTDDDRRAYLLHMRSLEVVKGKPGAGPAAPPPVPNPAAPAAVQTPYKDPVVERALEYLRTKLRDGGAAIGDSRRRSA